MIGLAEAIETTRADIIALLARDPYSPIAQLLGQALADLAERASR